ncbi:uracil-DNA glycosylase [Peribacillus sp. SCS-155]|uniref:uracil-DNA glycosylase n=1 Tax=Peribacillus sedimenti TaxID=3115297 RepID=UPI0039060C2B
MEMTILQSDWKQILAEEFEKDYFHRLKDFLDKEYNSHIIHPDVEDIFNALQFTPYSKVKVVILGQDPYHGPNQAHGLSFSVKPGVPLPPSLRNIFKELHQDMGCPIPNNGSLVEWAHQGVLLLNTVLTVRDGQAHSHRGKGWEIYTDEIIKQLSNRDKPIIFVLWGKPAQSKLPLIDTNRHKIITSAHPSPLSAKRGFFGSRPFSKVNSYLKELGETEINWQISDL